MDRIAFVFSGQGDQYSGMGKELCEKYPSAAKVFEKCDELRSGTVKQCFSGSEDELKETKNTQPCMFAVELAIVAVLREKGIAPQAAAGFSLGEVAALTAVGMVDFKTGFELVCERGQLMQREAEKHETSMAAVVKLTDEKVEELCAGFDEVYPVNFNCPGQVTCAGLSSSMADFSAAVKAAGGRAIPLKVKGAFHSPFMNDAADDFADTLSKISFSKSDIPLYSDVTALPYGDNPAELLSKQICSPVRFEKIIRNMIEQGITAFVEIGPGKTLTNMIKKIDAEVKAYSTQDIELLVSELNG